MCSKLGTAPFDEKSAISDASSVVTGKPNSKQNESEVIMAIAILKEARELYRDEARAYQSKYKGNGIALRARNKLLEAAKLTVAIMALTNGGVA